MSIENSKKEILLFTFISCLISLCCVNTISIESLQPAIADSQSKTSYKKIEHTLAITGTASKTVPTNIVILGLNIETLEDTLAQSYKKNNEISRKLANYFKQLNIPDKNITTTNYYSTPKYRSVRKEINNTFIYDNIFEGYQVSNLINAKLSDLKMVGYIIDYATSLGRVLITQITFDYYRPLQKQIKDSLLPLATKDAIERSKISASALKLIIKDVKTANVREFSPFSPINYNYRPESRAYPVAAAYAPAPPTIFSGTTKIDSNIDVTFIISKL